MEFLEFGSKNENSIWDMYDLDPLTFVLMYLINLLTVITEIKYEFNNNGS
jgi:hypothetical protein